MFTRGPNASLRATQSTSSPMDSMEKMMPKVDATTFWLVLNVVLFLYVGIFQLAYGYGPGMAFSAGAVLLAVLYLLLWMWGKTNMKMARQLIMMISGLAFLGDLVVIAWLNQGSFSGTSALLDFASVMLFRSTYKEMKA